MKILVTGRGTSGSWQVRGVQLGHVMGARVKPKATLKDCQAADVIVVVKRMSPDLLDNIKRSGKPWFWDVVDFYPQPQCSLWIKQTAVDWVRKQIKKARPNGVIWANERMMDDCGAKWPGTVIYHHHRPGIEVNPIRPEVKAVGYEGSAKYLAEWEHALVDACRQRGWTLKVNPARLADVDIVVAFRGKAYSGYAQRHWKSNVKLANCHGSGTPFVGQSESGYLETEVGGERWCDHPGNVGQVLDSLTYRERKAAQTVFLQHRISVEQAAAKMKGFIGDI